MASNALLFHFAYKSNWSAPFIANSCLTLKTKKLSDAILLKNICGQCYVNWFESINFYNFASA